MDPLPLKNDTVFNINDFTDGMDKDDVISFSEAVQDFLASEMLRDPLDLVVLLAKSRNALIVPLPDSIVPACCREARSNNLIPHDLILSMEVTSRKLYMLLIPSGKRASVCWRKTSEFEYCRGRCTNPLDFTCGSHSDLPKLINVPIINSQPHLPSAAAPLFPLKTLQKSLQLMSLDDIKSGLTKKTLEAALDLVKVISPSPPGKQTTVEQLKLYLASTTFSNDLTTVSYDPHLKRMLVRFGEDGPWEPLCRANLCTKVLTGKDRQFCSSHYELEAAANKQAGLQDTIMKMLTSKAGLSHKAQLLAAPEKLTPVAVALFSGEKLKGTFNSSAISIVLKVIENRGLLAVEQKHMKYSTLELCQNGACLKVYNTRKLNCPLCLPSTSYFVGIYRNQDSWFIGRVDMRDRLVVEESFQRLISSQGHGCSGWKLVTHLGGALNLDEANSMVIAANLALFIEATLTGTSTILTVAKRPRLGSQIVSSLRYLLKFNNLKLVTSPTLPVPFNEQHFRPTPIFTHEDRTTRAGNEPIIYECTQPANGLVYVGENYGKGDHVISAIHAGSTDPSRYTKLVKDGQPPPANRVVASIASLINSKSSSAINEQLKGAETIVMLSRIFATQLYRNTAITGIVNFNVSNLVVTNPKNFLYHIMTKSLADYGMTFSYETKGGKAFQPSLLK